MSTNLLKKDVWIRVFIMDKEEKFYMSLSATAAFVLYRVLSFYNVKECRYFTLFYLGNNPDDLLANHERVIFEGNTKLKTLLKSSCSNGNRGVVTLKLEVICYPLCITKVSDLNAVKLIYHEVKNDIQSGKLPCPADDLIYFAACSLQVKFGDYDSANDQQYLKEISGGQLMPLGVVKTVYGFSQSSLLERVVYCYKECRGWSILRCHLKYIKRAQSLSQYGMHLFDGSLKSVGKIRLGVSVHGLSIFSLDKQLEPKESMKWDDIDALVVNKNKFTIKCAPQTQKISFGVSGIHVTLRVSGHKACKEILRYAMMHHHFYMLFSTSSTMRIRKSSSWRFKSRQMDRMGVELPTLLDQRCDTIKSVMSSNDSFFAEISELETSEIIKEKKKATITRSHSAFDPPKSWKRRINRYHDELSEKGPIDCRLNEISADESETPRKEESLYVEMIQSGSKLDARSTKNDNVQNILATKGKEDIFSPTRKSIDNGLLGTCSIQLEIDHEENSGPAGGCKVAKNGSTFDPTDNMPPISTAQERSPLACANVQGIATPIKASSSFQTLIKSSGKLSWSARSKKARKESIENEEYAHSLFSRQCKDIAESSFASLLEQLDAEQTGPEGALKFRSRLTSRKKSLDAFYESPHDNVEAGGSFMRLDIPSSSRDCRRPKSAQADSRNRIKLPAEDHCPTFEKENQRVLEKDRENEMRKRYREQFLGVGNSPEKTTSQPSHCNHSKSGVKFVVGENSLDPSEIISPSEQEKITMRSSIVSGNTKTRVKLFEDPK